MTDEAMNIAVAEKLGWVVPPGTYFGTPPDDDVRRIIPDYCGNIALAWELTKYIPHGKFFSWPTAKELCTAFLDRRVS